MVEVSSTWRVEIEATATSTWRVEITPKIITQQILLRKKDVFPHVYISGAIVKVDGVACTNVGAEGDYYFDLPQGKEVTAEIVASGYKNVSHTFTVTAGKAQIIELEEGVADITQNILLIKADSEPPEYIEGATVTVDGKRCTEVEGVYSVVVPESTEATALAKATGYKDKTETFTTTGIATVRMYMEEEVAPPVECTQELIIRFTDDPNKVADVFYTVKGGLPNIPAKSATPFTVLLLQNTEVTVNVGRTPHTIDSFKSFRACTGAVEEIPLEVPAPPPPGVMTQMIFVRRANIFPYEYIEGATVTVDGVACEEAPDGLYTLDLQIGVEVTATSKAAGYHDMSLTFTVTEFTEQIMEMEREDYIATLPEGTELEEGTITPAQQDAFEAIDIPLSDDATIEQIDEDTWEVIDGENEYLVEEEDGELVVYGPLEPVPPVPPEPEPPEIPPPEPGEMTQVILVHEAGIYPFKYIEGATVTVDGKRCIDGGGGHYFINLVIGAEVTATISKEGYETVEHAFTVTVGRTQMIPLPIILAPDRFEITITNLDVVADIKKFAVGCFTPSPLLVDWFNMIGGKQVTYKKLSRYDPTETVIFQPSDGLIVGQPYVFRQGREFFAPIVGDFFMNLGAGMIGLGEGAELKGVQQITVDARSLELLTMPMPLQWLCSTLGVADCTAFMAETGVELFVTQHAWKCRLEGTDVYGNPCTPTAFDDMWIGIDIVGIIPFATLGKAASGMTKFSKALKATGNLKWLDDPANLKLYQKATAASSRVGMGDALKFVEADDMAGFTKWCNDAIAAGNPRDMARLMAKGMDDVADKFKTTAEYEKVLKNGHLLDSWIEVITDALKGQDPIYVKKFLDDIVSPKNITIIEHSLAKFPTEFTNGYALFRFSKPEYITALKNANLFDTIKAVLMSSGSDDLLKASAKSFNDDELKAIYKNLDDAGAGDLTLRLKTLLKVFDFAAIQDKIMAKVAAGDWVGALKEWELGVAGVPQNVYKLEARLPDMHAPVQRIHNIMRYTDLEYIKALDEAPGQLQKGYTFLVNHLIVTGEPTNYLDVIKALSPEQYSAVIRNLDTVEAHDVAKLIEALDVTVDAAKQTGTVEGITKVRAVLEDTVKVGSQPGATDVHVQLMKAAKQTFKEALDNIPPSLKDGDLLKEFSDALDVLGTQKNKKAWNYAKRYKNFVVEQVEKISGKGWGELSWPMRSWHYLHAMMVPCFGLFIIEEMYQQLGFTTMAAKEIARGFSGLTLTERQEIIDHYQATVNFQKVIFAAILPVNAMMSILCFPIAPGYVAYTVVFAKNVSENQWQIDQLQKGLDPDKGYGNVEIPIIANMQGVEVYIDQKLQDKLAGTYRTYYTQLLKADSQQYAIVGMKKGYVQKEPLYVTVTTANMGEFGEPINDTRIELVPESTVIDAKPADIPFGSGREDINYDDIPVSWGGNCPDHEFWGGYGDIDCRTTGGGAEIWLISAAGVRKYAGKTNEVVKTIPVGDYIVEFIKEGYRCTDCPNCRVPVHVRIGEPVNAWCTMAEISDFEPVAKLIVKPSTYANTGEELSFGAEGSEPGTGASFTSFVFDFGDGTPSVTITSLAIPTPPKHAYTAEGDYTAKLTITNSDGLIGEDFVYLTISGAEGTIDFYRETHDKLKADTPEIWFKKEGTDSWEQSPQAGPSGTYHDKVKWPVGRYEIEYRYLEITRCGKTVEVLADKETPFSCALSLYLPDQTVVPGVNNVKTTVTGIIDGDTIRTAFTDGLSHSTYFEFQSVRLVGYDSPDLTIIDKYATEKLKSLIPIGTPITLKIVSYNVLGKLGRVLAAVTKDADGTDINKAMIQSCLVLAPEYKDYEKDLPFNWIMEFSEYHCDPKSDKALGTINPVTGKTYISLIVTPAAGTVQINNRWLPVYAIVRKFKKGEKIGVIDAHMSLAIEADTTSATYGYEDSTDLRLVVSSEPITPKNLGIEIETVIISDVVDTYAVTFTSDPATAKVTVTSKKVALSRLTSVLRAHRDSTPLSRFLKKQGYK